MFVCRHFLRSTAGLLLAVPLALLLSDQSAPAGEYNEVLSIGDKAPTWANLPGTDGKSHSLVDYANKDVLVLVFTCASCPTAVDYEGRLQALASQYAASDSRVVVLPVSVNKVPADQLEALTERVKAKEFTFHYLHDDSQKIAKDYGAIFTPEFYVFDRERKLVYMGAMDDSTDADKVQKRYVEAAIEAALAGKLPEVTETIARGCRVRYARERRGK